MIKNADIDYCKYFGYGIGFDRHRRFSHPSGRTGRNVIIFGVDMSSSKKIDSRKKRYFNSWKRPYTRIKTYSECSKNAFN